MAPPASLADIGREAFDLLEKTYGHRRRRPDLAPPPLPTQQKAQPCVYSRTEAPLITERLPVVSYPSQQYQQPGHLSFHRSEVPLHPLNYRHYPPHHSTYLPAEDDADAVDSDKAAILFKGTKIVEYHWFY